jgi:hypothetical protein
MRQDAIIRKLEVWPHCVGRRKSLAQVLGDHLRVSEHEFPMRFLDLIKSYKVLKDDSAGSPGINKRVNITAGNGGLGLVQPGFLRFQCRSQKILPIICLLIAFAADGLSHAVTFVADWNFKFSERLDGYIDRTLGHVRLGYGYMVYRTGSPV